MGRPLGEFQNEAVRPSNDVPRGSQGGALYLRAPATSLSPKISLSSSDASWCLVFGDLYAMSNLEVMEVDFTVAGRAILSPSHLLEKNADRASLLLLLRLLSLSPMMTMAHGSSDLVPAFTTGEAPSPKKAVGAA